MNKSNAKVSAHYRIEFLYSINICYDVFVSYELFNFFCNMFYSKTIKLLKYAKFLSFTYK